MDVELESIASQIGTAVIDKLDGRTIKATGDLAIIDEENVINPCTNIYKILKSTAKCLDGEPLKRLSLQFEGFNYMVTLDDKHIYVVKVASGR